MQKTILFGKKLSLLENTDPRTAEKTKCMNCIRLQAYLTELQMNMREGVVKGQEEGVTSDSAVVIELVQLKNKFVALKKRLEVVEKENDQIF